MVEAAIVLARLLGRGARRRNPSVSAARCHLPVPGRIFPVRQRGAGRCSPAVCRRRGYLLVPGGRSVGRRRRAG
jgi:hypothetical protein